MLPARSPTPRVCSAARHAYRGPSGGSWCRFRGANQRAFCRKGTGNFRPRCSPPTTLTPTEGTPNHRHRHRHPHPYPHPQFNPPLPPHSQNLGFDMRLLRLGLRHKKMKTDLASLGGVLNRREAEGARRLDKPISEHLLWRSM